MADQVYITSSAPRSPTGEPVVNLRYSDNQAKTAASKTPTATPRTTQSPARPATVSTTEAEKRSYLTETEVERLMKAAGTNRDRCMILMAYRHGLRVSELVWLKWRQINLDTGRVEVERLKRSDNSIQPLSGREIRLLRKLKRGQEVATRFVFLSYQGAPMTRQAFYKMLRAAGAKAGISDVRPHLLRHGCGFKLVNDGVDTRTLAAYLGHRSMQNTVRYTKMSATRFDGFWKD